MKINDMPAEIKRLRAALDTATRLVNPHGWWIVQSEPEGINMWPTSEDVLLKMALHPAQTPVKPDRYAWYQYMDHGNGMGWIERMVGHDPRTPDYAEMYHGVDWDDTKQVRNFRALYTAPPAQTDYEHGPQAETVAAGGEKGK